MSSGRLSKSVGAGSREPTDFWCAPHCPQVERFRARISRTSFAAHAHEGFVVAVVHRGTQAFKLRGSCQLAGAGCVVLLNPGEIHAVSAADRGGVDYQTLHVPPDMVKDIAGQGFEFREAVVSDPGLARRLVRSFGELDTAMEAERWYERLVAAFMEVARAGSRTGSATSTSQDARLRHLLQKIESHLPAPFGIKALAQEAGISMQHLDRCFRRHLGLTPQEYLRARRLAYAKRLLRSHAPAEAATIAGFTDQSHLTRWLKACYGTTPGAYRKQLRAVVASDRQPGRTASRDPR